MRVPGARTLARLGRDDLLVARRNTGVRPEWMDDTIWRAVPEELTVREIQFALEIEGFRTRHIVLATTMLDALPYRRRWQAELFLRDIKISMRMDVLKCQSPLMIEKELLMYMIAYNLVRSLMLDAPPWPTAPSRCA